MNTVRVGLVIWLATLGYWLLWHGVNRLGKLGAGGASGGALFAADETSWLAMQPVPA